VLRGSKVAGHEQELASYKYDCNYNTIISSKLQMQERKRPHPGSLISQLPAPNPTAQHHPAAGCRLLACTVAACTCIRVHRVLCAVVCLKRQTHFLLHFTPALQVLFYVSSWVSIATPRLIQCSCGLSEGVVIGMTKLVECPVVERIPRRSLVLYSGHL